MNKNISYERYLKIIEEEYINNHKYVSYMKKDEKETFIKTIKAICNKFKIPIIGYFQLLEYDGCCCAICGKSRKELDGKLCLDHNHEYDYDDNEPPWLRGFLCYNCNRLLGYAKDSTRILKRAIHYLENSIFYDDVLYFPNKHHRLLMADRERIYLEQNGKCKICEIKESKLNREFCTDHDHCTGKVRGLLCGTCNFLLGACHDDINILKKAILYLKRNIVNILDEMPLKFIKDESPFSHNFMKSYYEYIAEKTKVLKKVKY